MPIRNQLVKMLQLDREALSHKIAKGVVTFLMVDLSWVFFRANSFREAVRVLGSMVQVRNPWILVDNSLYECGLDRKNFQLMIIGIVILLFADVAKHYGIRIREVISRQEYWFQMLLIPFVAWVVLLFGIWGSAYQGASFIYFQF